MRVIDRAVVALGAILVALAAGCGNSTSATTAAAPSSRVQSAVVTTAANARTAMDAAPELASTSTIAPPMSTVPWAVDDVVVHDAHLPSEVTEAYLTAGGDLVQSGEWERRFGCPAGFPKLTGSSAHVVEALYRIEPAQSGGGWVRTDEMSWLVVDDRERDGLLAAVASTIGARLDEWEPAPSIDDGAECVSGPLRASVPGEWTLQGCGYPRFTGLLAVGLTRTASSENAPVPIDPTVVAVASATGAQPVYSEVRLGQPGADGSTLHLSTQVRFDPPIDVASTADALAAKVLSGWQLLRGDESVLLAGPTGGTWTITSTVAVFEWAGRW